MTHIIPNTIQKIPTDSHTQYVTNTHATNFQYHATKQNQWHTHGLNLIVEINFIKCCKTCRWFSAKDVTPLD